MPFYPYSIPSPRSQPDPETNLVRYWPQANAPWLRRTWDSATTATTLATTRCSSGGVVAPSGGWHPARAAAPASGPGRWSVDLRHRRNPGAASALKSNPWASTAMRCAPAGLRWSSAYADPLGAPRWRPRHEHSDWAGIPWLPQRLVLVGDGGYAVLDLLHCCQSFQPVTLIARLTRRPL